MNYLIYLFQLLVHVVIQDVMDCNLHVCNPYLYIYAYCFMLTYKVFYFVNYLLYCSIIFCYFEVQ